MKTFLDIVRKLDRNELVALNRDVLRQIKLLDEIASDQFVKGHKVHFTSTRDGATRNGTVDKVGRKYVVIKTEMLTWKVPGSMVAIGWVKTTKAA